MTHFAIGTDANTIAFHLHLTSADYAEVALAAARRLTSHSAPGLTVRRLTGTTFGWWQAYRDGQPVGERFHVA